MCDQALDAKLGHVFHTTSISFSDGLVLLVFDAIRFVVLEAGKLFPRRFPVRP